MSVINRNTKRTPGRGIHFRFKDNPKFGMLNLGLWKNEIKKIQNYDRKIINDKTIIIHYPMINKYYVKSYTSQNGFTFRQLVDKIVKVGIQAGKYSLKHCPENYFKVTTAEHTIGEYAITSSPKSTDIKKTGNKIFISLQH